MNSARRLDARKYRGQWVALDPRTHRVVAHGKSLAAVRSVAAKKGYTRPLFHGVPASDGYFVGGF